jgi:hypothetical protein
LIFFGEVNFPVGQANFSCWSGDQHGNANMKKVPLKTVKHWLLVMARVKPQTSYTAGVKIFMRHWPAQNRKAIMRVCEQLQEVAIGDPVFAIAVFGQGAANFFKGLAAEEISWGGKQT